MKKKTLKTFFILVSLLPSLTSAQSFFIKGEIHDEQTNEALVYVNLALKNSYTGTITNDLGAFQLKSPTKNDTLLVSMVGYSSLKIPITANKNIYLKLTMQTNDIQISEIDVTPGKNPAFEILKQINKHKKENNYFNYKELQMRVYNKISLSLNNVDENIFKSKTLKPFDFLLQYADSSDFTKNKILPVFISETISDFYAQKNPKKTKEIILANKMSGVENKSYSQFTGQLYADLDIYQNIIPLFEKSFINPAAIYGRPYYKYYLIDSVTIDKDTCYYIQFKPRFKRELTFSGDMYIEKSSYGIKKIKVKTSPKANINYVKDLEAELLFDRDSNNHWFPATSKLNVLLELTEKQISLFGQKTTRYSKQKTEIENKQEIFNESFSDVKTANDVFKAENYWQKERPEQLSSMETNIYHMVDTLMHNKRFQFYQKFSSMLYLGYWESGNFEYGPYYSTYSFNAIEGNRFRLGGRTSNQFSKKIMLSGYGAYGDKDNKFKYGLSALYVIQKKPRLSIKTSWKDDLVQLSASSNAFSTDNISNSIFSVSNNNDLLRNQTASFELKKQWQKGINTNFTLNYRNLFPSPFMVFREAYNNFHFSQITDASAIVNIRFAFGEKFLEGAFEQTAIPSDFPVINFNATYGNAKLNNTIYPYSKLEFSYSHNFIFAFLGYFEYSLSTGKVFGQLPYPLLKLHSGNETYYYDNLAFNLMNYYEFASDIYGQVNITHHFDGLFLSKLPLINSLNLRSLVTAKVLFGNLSPSHQNIIQFPESLSGLNGKPYIEAGIGIENILKVMRIDALWRLSYKDKPNAQNFGIRAMFQLIL